MLTQERVRELFDYSPESGDLIRKVRVANRTHIGDVVGSPHGDGYLKVWVDYKSYYLHRVIWVWLYGCFPKQIDHINHIRDDNRWCNIREANNQENHRNQSMDKRNTSGFTGVRWHKRDKKWMAYIRVDGKAKHLGLFTDKSDAISARQTANIKFGFHQNHGAV